MVNNTTEKEILIDLMDRESRNISTEDYLQDQQSKKPTQTNFVNYPDAKLHQLVSFVKSGIRILACFAGCFGFIGWGFAGLLLAELVGIIEELV